MKLLRTIRDGDVGSDIPDCIPTQERRASRAVVFDADGNLALLHATKKHFHKLPGGGIEEGEDIETALRRELMEEIGCSVKKLRELGSAEEYRNKWELHQISYCFLTDLDGQKGTPHLEDYEGKFIPLRDVTLLKEAHKNR